MAQGLSTHREGNVLMNPGNFLVHRLSAMLRRVWSLEGVVRRDLVVQELSTHRGGLV